MNKLVWLRNDLRTHDQRAFEQAFEACEAAQRVFAVYCICDQQWDAHHVAISRRNLAIRTLASLAQQLKEKGVVLILQDSGTFSEAIDDVCALATRLHCDQVFISHEYPFNEYQRDKQAAVKLQQLSIELVAQHTSCLIAPGVIKNNAGNLYKVFTPFKRTALEYISQHPGLIMPGNICWQQPVNAAENCIGELDIEKHNRCIIERYLAQYPVSDQMMATWSADETEVLKQLEVFCHETIADYQQQRDFPSVSGTSQLSAYLSLGALSVRQALHTARRIAGDTEGFMVWQSELLWRDFYRHIIRFNPHICMGKAFKKQYQDLPWRDDASVFKAWKQGQTGYPLIDAAMRQLNQTGWMHNRLRMVVAIFLCKYALIDWRKGEDYFMSKLIDGDIAANNGGWQWCASTGTDAVPYFRLLSPIRQAQRFDPSAEFIKRYIPELRHCDAKDIVNGKYSAWADVDYPAPIIEIKGARDQVVSFFKQHRKN